MRKFLTAALATAMLATPFAATAADAAPQHDQRRQTTVVRHNNNGHNTVVRRNKVVQRKVVRPVVRTPARHAWAKGQRFEQRYATNYREIDYRTYRGRGLYAPPRGYHWVRSGNDAVLVAITSGLIGAVIGGAIN